MHDKEHRYSELSNIENSDKYTEREKVAVAYTDAIVWNPELADDSLWAKLHANFSEPEIVELGYWAGFTSGGQRWLHTLHTNQGELQKAIEKNYLCEVFNLGNHKSKKLMDVVSLIERNLSKKAEIEFFKI